METTDQATSNWLKPGHMDERIQSELTSALSSDDSSKEDEDFLSGLNPEEKECLEYFIQTIRTLDEDGSEGDDEGCHEEMANSVGSEDQGKSGEDSSMHRRTSLETAPAMPLRPSGLSKMKTFQSVSEEVSASSLRSRSNSDYLKPGGSCRSRNSRPIHLRRFDTIMRSGVSVQELRSRFLLHLNRSTRVDRKPREAGAGMLHQLGPLLGIQKSPKDEALQKLGLLQINASVPNMTIPLVHVAGQQPQTSPGGNLDPEGTVGSTNTPEEPL
ncbi:hypothetical protein JRQ81_003301 [Phrynocephalus forsythii]|uniref:Uncharacterized protein n=1 Tax=Phrynocephalus forsythii TaxID=171643 RepID=A0A9Q0XJL7_9SAUR|nr:hypothetical protein JRQ81_003301 [Phrynocephalus forsythii]